jgi:raffinose/stachyose/melibiose transport system substrate-binding protein
MLLTRSRWAGHRNFRMLTIASIAVLLGGCLGVPGATQAPSVTPAPTPGLTAVATPAASSDEPVTLTVIDVHAGEPGTNRALEQINADFTAANPNVTIDRQNISFTDALVQTKLALSGPNPPDIMELQLGVVQTSQLVKAGLLLNLAEYAETYGWADKYPAALWALDRFTPDGQIRQGDPYMVFLLEDIVGIYYNRSKLAALGVEVPTTFEDFEAALEKAKTAGEIPIMMGNLDKWPAVHVYAICQNRYASKSYLRDYQFRQNDVSYDVPENRQALELCKSWGDKGYFEPDFNGVGYDDAWQRFANGEGVFLPAGTWLTGGLIETMDENAGFFAAPPPADGSNGLTVTGERNATFMVSARTAHPDVAAAYLDSMISDESAQILTANGAVPGFKTTTPLEATPGSLLADVIATIQASNEQDALVGYADFPTASMIDTLGVGLQELFTDRMTVDEFVAAVQADYASAQ